MLTVFWNLGFRFSMNKMMMPAMGILFFYMGILVEHAKRNWFVGIRTPWTLSSGKVWDATHKLGGKLFKAAGIVAFLGIFFQKYTFWFVMIPIAFVVGFTPVYSYAEFRRE